MTLNLTIKELHINVEQAHIHLPPEDSSEALAKINELNQVVGVDTESMQNAVNNAKE